MTPIEDLEKTIVF